VVNGIQLRSNFVYFYYPRYVVRGICYGDVAGWMDGWLSVTAGIVSKRLNLS